ncbi:MAG: hypothetical protein PSX71_07840 [bacterium]|nr:hypothetical protein [bacterium]
MSTVSAPGSTPLHDAGILNLHCPCRTRDDQRLLRQLAGAAKPDGPLQSLLQTHPHLFSATTVFISGAEAATIAAAVAAIERVFALPAYQTHVLASAPPIARADFGPVGVFMGFDFHLGANGPQLIEINTNAGGGLLNTVLAQAQLACCNARLPEAPAPDDADRQRQRQEQTFVDMFVAEWKKQRGNARMGSLFIVDDAPAQQYLAPEFVLFQEMFQRHGLASGIADASNLVWRDGKLWHDDTVIDMIYNRLTDFYLEAPEHAALRQAYEAGAVVLTPHPRAHALHASKSNLVILCDEKQLASWGVPAGDREVLQAVVPATQRVTAADADDLWSRRRQLFFKPVGGYAGKAAYRGDKLTRRVWADIVAGDFVAQALVVPGQRRIAVNGALSDFKFDIRAYTYAASVQLLAARMYAGQTTNFRTEGGGFAPVKILGETGCSNCFNTTLKPLYTTPFHA